MKVEMLLKGYWRVIAPVDKLKTLRPDLDLIINGDAMTVDVFDESGACLHRYRLK